MMSEGRISVDEQIKQVEEAKQKWQTLLLTDGLCSAENEVYLAWKDALLALQIRVVVAAGVPLGCFGERRSL
jgi:hypothetical protein